MKQSFVRSLMAGKVDLDELNPFPLIQGGRLQQLEPLLDHIRSSAPADSGVQRLRDWDLLHRPAKWPTPMLTRAVREIATVDVSAALCCIAHLALGVRLVRQFGSEKQVRSLQEEPLPVFAFALTEASPGSDVSQVQTYAEPTARGYVLSGTKQWVTNATEATHFIVLARTVPPHAGDKPRLTAFLLPRGEGVLVEPIPSHVLSGAGVGKLVLQNVAVPKDAMLGTRGKGFRVVMHGLSEARLLVGAAVLGSCIKSFDETIERLNRRRAFGRSVGNFPSVQDRISAMLADLLAMESLVHGAAAGNDLKESADPVERAVVRLCAARASARILDAARELHGAAAFAGDSESARRWTDTRALSLLDGSDLALESYITLEGTREIRHRLEALANPREPLMRIEAFRLHAVDKMKSRLSRVLNREVPGVRVHELEKLVAELGEHVTEQLKRQGSDIVEMQHVQRRIATITTDLATWYALCVRVQTEVARHGEVGSRRMVEAAEIWVRAAAERVRVQFKGLAVNDDRVRDRIANRAYADNAYPFDVF